MDNQIKKYLLNTQKHESQVIKIEGDFFDSLDFY